MPEENVLGEELAPCSTDPTTGYLRDGHCRSVPGDVGRHELCAVMTEAFLSFTRERGNDLTTPRPELDFPGLEPGERWCLCVGRWVEAHEAGRAPPVVLAATHAAVLDEVPLDTLRGYDHRHHEDADGGD
ncbi:MAG: DUF2237 family protein [Halobacteriaceae archaeon]